MKQILVVSEIQPGWCPVVAVFEGLTWEAVEARFPSDRYTIEEFVLEKNLKNWVADPDS